MGNSSVKGPKTEKFTRDGQNRFLKYGVCEMQGWRNNMVKAFLYTRKMPVSRYSIMIRAFAFLAFWMDMEVNKFNSIMYSCLNKGFYFN